MRIVTILLVITLLLGGCSGKAANSISHNNDTKITVKKVDLFKGKEAKYEPFLGMSRAFQVEYKGNKPNVTLELEIWEKGRKTGSVGAIHDLFFDANDSQSGEMEIILSNEIIALTEHGQFMKTKISILSDSGATQTSFTNEWDEKWNGSGLISIEEEQAFTVNESTYVPVFGIQTTSNNRLYTADFSQQSLERMEYALIFALHIE